MANTRMPKVSIHSYPKVVRFSVLYFLFAEIGHMLSFEGHFATFWPPAGLYFAYLVANSRRNWLPIIISALVANTASDTLLHDKSILVSLGLGVANTVEAVASASLLVYYFKNHFRFQGLKQVAGFCFISAFASPWLGSILGATVIHFAFGADWGTSMLRWWVSDSMGVMIVAPMTFVLLLRSSHDPVDSQQSSLVDYLHLGVITSLLTFFIFGTNLLPFPIAILPLFLWLAVRHELVGVSVGLLCFTVTSVWLTRSGSGPMVEANAWESVIALQAFTGVLAISSHVVAAVMSESRIYAEQARFESDRYRDLFDNMNDMVQSVSPQGEIQYVNRAWLETLGYTASEVSSLNIFEVIHPEEHEHCQLELKRLIYGEQLHNVETRFVTKQGVVLNVEGSMNCRTKNGEPIATRGIFRDITQRKTQERQLERYRRDLEYANLKLLSQATTDVLTGLANRRAFDHQLDSEIDYSTNVSLPLSLIMLDIDHFKQLNDTFGHTGGDEVLMLIGNLLKNEMRASDSPARFGGEEFTVLLPNTGLEEAVLIAERIRRQIESLKFEETSITASFGVATFDPQGDIGLNLVELADQALYQSKKSGRNCVSYTKDLFAQPRVSYETINT